MTAIAAGVDLSLASTGLAVVTETTIHINRVQSRGTADPTLPERRRRLSNLTHHILDVLIGAAVTGRTLVVVEGPSYGQTRQGGQHDRAGLWWLLVDRMLDMGWAVAEVPPASRAKYATGKGNAAKDSVMAAAIRRYPMAEIVGHDVADAVVLAAMGAHALGQPPAVVPALNATALAKVAWPALNLEGITHG